MSAPVASEAGNGAAGKAIGVAFLVLILANGNMQPNMQLALVVGVIAYMVFNKPKAAAGGHH